MISNISPVVFIHMSLYGTALSLSRFGMQGWSESEAGVSR
jgi:hypothetical protein